MSIKICAVCGKAIDTDTSDYVTTADGEYVCGFCARTGHIQRCLRCHSWIILRPGVSRCKACEEEIYKCHINSYSTKPVPQFKNAVGENGKEYNVRYYGLEMEFNNCNPDTVYNLCENLYLDKWIYNKSDSSISGGVEIVTSPLDKKSVIKLMKNMEPIFNYVDGKNYSSNAGLHIHVTKKSISPQDRYKLCILLNNTKTIMEKNMLYFLSGRTSLPDSITTNINDHYFQIGTTSRLKAFSTGHTVALNTSNSNTYEFRIFKSSNKPEVLLSYVEMVDTMIDFVHVNGIKDITVSNYIEWLKVNTKNEVLLNKIKEFETNLGKIQSSRPIILNTEILSMLRGVNWKDYYKVIYILSNEGRKHLRGIKDRLPNYSNDYIHLNRMPSDDVCQRLEKTLRMCLIKSIQKEERNILQCV